MSTNESVVKAMLESANRHDAHIIVLGSARSTDLPPIPFGSVSLKVLHLARRPVIVVPRQALSAAEQAVVTSHVTAVPVTP